MSVCIVIPSFNENENINLLLDEIYKIDLNNFSVVIIDDSRESFKNQILFNELDDTIETCIYLNNY